MPSLLIDDCELAFDDSGPRRATTLVLLHGFLGCKEDWQTIRAALDRRLRIVAMDLPGHGRTRAAHFPQHYSIDGICRLLDALLERLGVRDAIVVGYSMGGRVALAYALHSQRPLRGLVLESASAGLADPLQRRLRADEDQQRAAALERHGLRTFIALWESQPLFATQAALAPSTRELQRDLRLRGDARELAASLRAAGAGAQPWFGDRLATLTLPVLLICGALDPKFSTIAEQMFGVLPDARRLCADGAGHNVHLEKPDWFASALGAFADEIASNNDNQGVRP